MAIISGSDLEFLHERFSEELKSDVQLNLFTRASYHTAEAEAETEAAAANEVEDETGLILTGQASRVTAQILAELAAIAPDSIEIITHDLDSQAGQQAAQAAGLDGNLLPAIVYQSEHLKGQSRYYGLPSGYEFGSMVENIVDLSSGEQVLKPATLDKLAAVKETVMIMVFVTPT